MLVNFSRQKLLIVVGVVGILVGILIVWMGKDTRRLPDGSTLKLIDVQCGSPILFTEYPSGWFLYRLTRPIQRAFGSRNSDWKKFDISLNTESNAMQALIMHYTLNNPLTEDTPDPYLFARLVDDQGHETEKASLTRVTPNAGRVPLVCAFLPNHSLETNLTLRIYDSSVTTGEVKVAEFQIKNLWSKK